MTKGEKYLMLKDRTPNKRNKIIFMLIISTILLAVSCGGNGTDAGANAPTDHLSLGERFLLELEYEQALFHFLALFEIEPMNPRGHTGAAQALIGLSKPAEAIAILQQGLELIPDNADILDMLNELQKTMANMHLWYLLTDKQRDLLTRLEIAAELLDDKTAFAIMQQNAFLEIFNLLGEYAGQVRMTMYHGEYRQFYKYGELKSDENWRWELFSCEAAYYWSRVNNGMRILTRLGTTMWGREEKTIIVQRTNLANYVKNGAFERIAYPVFLDRERTQYRLRTEGMWVNGRTDMSAWRITDPDTGRVIQ